MSQPTMGTVASADGMIPNLSSSRIPALDGLRAIAVFLVIFYHFTYVWIPASLGVLAFFVLSGFLITWLLLKENEKSGTVSISGFYKRRALRIFPAFYCYWGGWLFLLLVTGHKVCWPDVMSAFFYVSNYYQGLFHPAGSYVTHTWSLAIEEQFYLLWPVSFYFGRHNLKRLSWCLAGLIGSVWVYRLVLSLVFHVNQAYIYRAFDTRIDHLLVGCLTAVIVKRGVLRPLWRAISAKSYLPLLTIGLLSASSYYTVSSTLYRDVVGFAIEPLLVAVLMIQLIIFSQTTAWGWFDSKPMRYLGQISYSLYLYHPAMGYMVFKRLAWLAAWERVGVALLVTIAMASASYYFIEKPFLRLKDGALFSRIGLKWAARPQATSEGTPA
jgi:peptidoglycan/LPS O-acetylase OafA/YrhL